MNPFAGHNRIRSNPAATFHPVASSLHPRHRNFVLFYRAAARGLNRRLPSWCALQQKINSLVPAMISSGSSSTNRQEDYSLVEVYQSMNTLRCKFGRWQCVNCYICWFFDNLVSISVLHKSTLQLQLILKKKIKKFFVSVSIELKNVDWFIICTYSHNKY